MSDDARIDAPHDATLEPATGASPSVAGENVVLACPYLLAAGGAWRSSSPTREHRCTAVAPAAALALDKQRRLCLAPAHQSCATYLAALAARRERGTPTDDGPPTTRWALARTTPVVDVGVGLGAAISGLATDRRAWQAIPAVVLLVALAAVGLSGIGREGPQTGALATATASLIPTPTRPSTTPPAPTAPASATPAPSGSPSPTPTLSPTPVASATPGPSARTSYTVKSGDTLYDIARTYGTTVAAIKELNGLTSNTLHVGQVLLIP